MTKLSKESVDYSKGTAEKHCGICQHFRKYGHDHSGKCGIVEGEIDPEYWCDKFEKSLRSSIKDAVKEHKTKFTNVNDIDEGDHEYR